MVFPSSSVKLLLTSCQSIFSCIDRASVVSRSCRRVFSGNASTATGVSGILKVTGRAKPPLFPSGITINGRMLKISLTRWLNAVTVVPAMFVYDARRLPLFPVAAHSASEYRQPATDTGRRDHTSLHPRIKSPVSGILSHGGVIRSSAAFCAASASAAFSAFRRS
ncbi:Uncharacterised protein [Shigella sonnei]|nr:Uncharacterised protein [Shigella sonnei]